jgi:DNA-binding NtrC family response regulator
MPSLRDHKEDIPAMAEAMVQEMNERHGTLVPGISRAVMDRFLAYSWPGNARELRNTIERAVILANGKQIDVSHLPPGFGEEQHTPPPHGAHVTQSHFTTSQSQSNSNDTVQLSVGMTVDEAEKQLILKTLEATRNNKTRAAEILGISSKTLQNKLKEYALEDKDDL